MRKTFVSIRSENAELCNNGSHQSAGEARMQHPTIIHKQKDVISKDHKEQKGFALSLHAALKTNISA